MLVKPSQIWYKAPQESLTLYIQWAISLLTWINHTSDMSVILASGLNHHKIITGLNLDKLHDKLATCAPNWHTMADCFHDVKKFEESYEQMKGYKEGLVSSEVVTVNHIIHKNPKPLGPWYKCQGPHLVKDCPTLNQQNNMHQFQSPQQNMVYPPKF